MLDWTVPDTLTLDLPLYSSARAADVRLLGLMHSWLGTDLWALAELDKRLGSSLYPIVKATRADLKARGEEALFDANSLVAGLIEALPNPDSEAYLRP